MLVFQNFTANLSEKKLFNDISVSLPEGSITYIKGLNGSGKTTMFRCLASLNSNYGGEVKLFGLRLEDYYKPYCLYIAHKGAMERDLKVIDQLEFWAESYNSTEMIPAAIEFWELESICEKKISTLSEGNAKKVALSRLTCCHADLWLLDEVETNLDESNLKLLHFAMLSKAQSGGIILISSHMKEMLKNTQVIDLKDYKI